jgi:hypothetical protein
VNVGNHHQVMPRLILGMLIQSFRERFKAELSAQPCSETNPAFHGLSHLRANRAEVQKEQLQQLRVII